MKGSTRTVRIVYSSVIAGSRLGPPIRGEKSGDDSGIPKSSPCRTTQTFPLFDPEKERGRVAGTTSEPPPRSEPIRFEIPLFSVSSSTFPLPLSSRSSSAASTATCGPFTALEASIAATRSAERNPFGSPLPPSSAPSYVQTKPSAEPHHCATAKRSFCPPFVRSWTVAPANSKLPDASEMSCSAWGDRLTTDEADEVLGSSSPGSETTNQRTDDPRHAALTAATSPTPPGGDTTTILDAICNTVPELRLACFKWLFLLSWPCEIEFGAKP
mmetsp:Transcript_26686/g.62683  ORF Transcript_26686/g.62683 Transcript_26686/m.62683 type:complete len:271 (-) Transcript_26686:245-1057(-)